jgi:hypothetical protein
MSNSGVRYERILATESTNPVVRGKRTRNNVRRRSSAIYH